MQAITAIVNHTLETKNIVRNPTSVEICPIPPKNIGLTVNICSEAIGRLEKYDLIENLFINFESYLSKELLKTTCETDNGEKFVEKF